MAETTERLSGVVAPKCKLCDRRHWTTEPEKCGLYEKPTPRRAEPVVKECLTTPAPTAAATIAAVESVPKTGGDATAVKTRSRVENTAQSIVPKAKKPEKPKTQTSDCSKTKKAGKTQAGGRPKKRALAPKKSA